MRPSVSSVAVVFAELTRRSDVGSSAPFCLQESSRCEPGGCPVACGSRSTVWTLGYCFQEFLRVDGLESSVWE
jgi:hypothetical protein